MTARKLASVSGTATVAAIAAYASYEHMRALALAAGQTPGIAAVLPFSVDGMILVASVALVDGRQRKASAWVAFGLGVLASMLANVLAAGPTLTDRCVSAWPSVALLATVEVIARGGSRRAPLAAVSSEAVASVLAPAMAPVYTLPEVSADAPDGATDTAKSPVSKAPRTAPAKPSNAVRVARAAERNPGASVSELARLARVSESTARRYRPVTLEVASV